MYKYISWLSLDVVAGACLNSWVLTRYYQVPVQPEAIGVLGLAVYLAYTYDHLADAKRANCPAASNRHQFHQRNQYLLTALAILALLGGMVLALTLPLRLVYNGLLLVGFCVIYFVGLSIARLAKWVPKEFLVAIGYVAGIFIIPLSSQAGAVDPDFGWLAGQYFCLAMVNLLIFSHYGQAEDIQDGFVSMVQWLGTTKIRRLAIWIGVAFGVLGGMCYWQHYHRPMALPMQASLWAVMIGLQLVLFFPHFFAPHSRYRAMGDGLLCLPGLLLLFPLR